MAQRLNGARGPLELLIPMRGWSIYGSKGGALYDPQGNNRLLKALKADLNPDIPIKEIDVHINDSKFADMCVERILNLIN